MHLCMYKYTQETHVGVLHTCTLTVVFGVGGDFQTDGAVHNNRLINCLITGSN